MPITNRCVGNISGPRFLQQNILLCRTVSCVLRCAYSLGSKVSNDAAAHLARKPRETWCACYDLLHEGGNRLYSCMKVAMAWQELRYLLVDNVCGKTCFIVEPIVAPQMSILWGFQSFWNQEHLHAEQVAFSRDIVEADTAQIGAKEGTKKPSACRTPVLESRLNEGWAVAPTKDKVTDGKQCRNKS